MILLRPVVTPMTGYVVQCKDVHYARTGIVMLYTQIYRNVTCACYKKLVRVKNKNNVSGVFQAQNFLNFRPPVPPSTGWGCHKRNFQLFNLGTGQDRENT